LRAGAEPLRVGASKVVVNGQFGLRQPLEPHAVESFDRMPE